MSDLSLFSSDAVLGREQHVSRRHVEQHLGDTDKALVSIADDREMRLHRRIRAFAWWLFVLPVLIWGLFVVVMFLVGQSLLPGR